MDKNIGENKESSSLVSINIKLSSIIDNAFRVSTLCYTNYELKIMSY